MSPGAKLNRDKTTAGLRADAVGLEDEPAIEEAPVAPRINPPVRRTNYEDFRNRYSEDESCFAIEVLEAGADISR